MKRLLTLPFTIATVGIAVIATVPTRVRVLAQNRMNYSIVGQNSGHVALGLAIRKLGVYGAFLQAPAHPDDETNALFAMFTHGMGLRSIDLQNNRGDGGQNEIGPELFRDIAVLRTSELLSAHRIDGAEQFFTRAIDYGYSFDPQEVISKWGREEIVGDYVRLLRTLRPDVALTMNIQGRGGDRAHEATTILFREAYYAAGDPSKYPEQLRAGLRPWQPKKLYFAAPPAPPNAGGRGGPGRGAAQATPATPPSPGVKLTPANTNAYDELLGRTYAEIGADARSNHKCQGTGGLPALPGFNNGRGGGAGPAGAGPLGAGQAGAGPPAAGQAGAAPAVAVGGGGGPGAGGYQLIDSTIPGQKDKTETSLFDGVDTRLEAIAQYAGPNRPAALISRIGALADDARAARSAFDSGNDAATAQPIEAGLVALRALRALLANAGGMGLDDAARYEIDFRLRVKERDYEDAVLAAHGLSFDAVADDGLVVAGQPVKLSILAVNRGASDVSVTGVSIAGFDAPAACAAGSVKKDAVYTCASDARVPKSARLTTPYFNDNYWKHPENPAIQIFDPGVEFGVPFAPTPFRVTFHVKAGNAEVTREVPVEFRYVKDLYLGDKRMELNVVPALSVSVTPALAVFPASSAASGGTAAVPVKREIHVTVTNGAKSAAQASVSLDLPAGWKATPANVPLSFAHEDEALSARFEVTAPPPAKAGQYTLRAVVTSTAFPNQKFSEGYEVIEYPHIQRRQVIKPAEAALKVVDVKVSPNMNVGYIVGVGDQVPPALEQLGAKVTYIDEDELAWGDLSKHDVIVTGVRAYERRADLRAYNRRLLDYVSRGGTVIVQYNKLEFNQSEYGPYPAKVSNNRVADELVPVKILAPADPVFTFPNRIGPATWTGWVQERGLYFLGEKDPKYIDLVSMTDSFKDNPGEKLGAMVEAKYGRGRWIYLGLGLWRQLPAGTDGAYQLLANLISLPKAKAGESAAR
ncbi:MAG TPA: PIG-L family deacetylase [Bryobacteraceae bacterium]|nr:PIG-L family deacetylase [Bryobacteraceae bacterium]